MARLGRLLLVLVALAPARLAAAADFDGAEKALRELRYDDARARLEAIAAAGNLARAELLELWALQAEVACVLDGAVAGERAFRKLLVLDPNHAPPRIDSPVFRQPFERARRWVSENGTLEIELNAPPEAASGAPTPLAIRAASDPLGMVAAYRLIYRADAEPTWRRLPASSGAPSLPPARRAHELRYYVEVLDAAGDVLIAAGSADEPLLLRVAAPPTTPRPAAPPPASPHPVAVAPVVTAPMPPPRHPLRRDALIVGSASLVVLALAVGLNLAAHAEGDRLLNLCAPNCTSAQVSRLHGEEGAAIASYSLAAAGAAVTVVLLIVDGTRKR